MDDDSTLASRILAPLLRWARRESIVALPVIGSLPGAAMRDWSEEPTLPIDLPTDAASPRHADLLIVVGRISQKAAPVLMRLHAELARPCAVLVVDAERGFRPVPAVYASVASLEEILPVDVVLRGAPPSPAAVARALDAIRRARAGLRP